MKKIILGLASLVLVFGLMGNVGAMGTINVEIDNMINE